MTTKLHINVKQGIIEADGEPKFVEMVYRDFKDEILKQLASPNGDDDGAGDAEPETNRQKKPSRPGKQKSVGKRATPKRARGGPSCADRILELKKKNAFAKNGLFADAVRAMLKDHGHIYAPNLVGATLTTLHKRGDLRRTNKDSKWLYLNP